MVKSYSTKNGKQVSIRTNTLEDLPKIRDCLISVWKSLGEYLPESWINRELHLLQTDELTYLEQTDDPNRISLVAQVDNNIVGVILGRTGVWNVNHLNFMGVEPSHRRRGIGRYLSSHGDCRQATLRKFDHLSQFQGRANCETTFQVEYRQKERAGEETRRDQERRGKCREQRR